MSKFVNGLIDYLLDNDYDEESFSTVVTKTVALTAEAAIAQIAAVEGKVSPHEYKQILVDFFNLK